MLRRGEAEAFVSAGSTGAVLAGGHSDDISLTDDPGKGWGWLANNGCDIIQTDWVQMARQYLESTGKRNFR